LQLWLHIAAVPLSPFTSQSWLLPHKTAKQHYWQYGYELRFTNSSDEPLQLLRKAWQVTELSGACAGAT
jgi:uncharacterized protein affecting Mg2+/Co2+ transport